ncbi:hypothetical protein LCGC14_0995190 [marine sediment metagenome]|uniref:Uncharacterized protein n=1 Tax=marine sediment metagenome TaxID=412755 RepID=A0A0F9QN25_9ZZZZ
MRKVLKLEIAIYNDDGTDVDDKLRDIIMDKIITIVEENNCTLFMFSTTIEEEEN